MLEGEALGIHDISSGRFAINLVNTWNRLAFERAGIVLPEHDARYRYGCEWLGVVKRLLEGERSPIAGANLAVADYARRRRP